LGAFGRNGAAQAFLFDGCGSTNALTNTAGVVTDTYLYQAFGVAVSGTGSSVNPFCFVGANQYYYDTDLLSYYLRARHYIPILGRFLSVDPWVITGEDVVPYTYAGNNPLSWNDPSGLACCCQVKKDKCEDGVDNAPPGPHPECTVQGMGGKHRGFPRIGTKYGQWCGAGNGNPNGPIDDLDACCCVHDFCYGTAPWYCAFTGTGPGILGCDADLCICATGIDCATLYPDEKSREYKRCRDYRKKIVFLFCGKVKKRGFIIP
jgi:RHS repeat-associated protein